MSKFFEALANMFRIPDLRNRVLFTLGLLAVYRLGAYIPTPGIDTFAFSGVLHSQRRRRFFRLPGCVQRRHVAPHDHFRARHYALHYVIDHSAVADRRGADARQAAERRRTGPPQDHPMDALSNRDAGLIQSFGSPSRLQNIRRQFRAASGPRLYLHDHADVHHRHGVYYVAGRADYRSRHRQRHVADHLHRHRGRAAARHRRHLPQHLCQRAQWPSTQMIIDPGRHGRGGGVYRSGGARRAPHPGAIRQARGRPPHDGRQSTHLPLKVNAGGVIPVIFASSLLAFPQTLLQFPFVQEQPWLSGMLESIGGASRCTMCCSSC